MPRRTVNAFESTSLSNVCHDFLCRRLAVKLQIRALHPYYIIVLLSVTSSLNRQYPAILIARKNAIKPQVTVQK